MKNLKRIRLNRGLTQLQLAEAAGCHQSTISKLERGSRTAQKNLTIGLAERIAAALRVPVVELFGLDEVQARYLTALRNATPERREAVLLLLEGGGS